TVKASSNTGLGAPDVFYFGNAVGERGNVIGDYSVSLSDELLARNNPASIVPGAPVTNRFDFNRDGTVSVIDQLLSRNNITTAINKLKQITVPAALRPSPLIAQGLQARSTSDGSSQTRVASQEAPASQVSQTRVGSTTGASSEQSSNRLPRRAVHQVSDDLIELLARGR